MKKILAALALAVLPVAAYAADMSYTYVDVEYAYSSQFTFAETQSNQQVGSPSNPTPTGPNITNPTLSGADGIIVSGSFGFLDNFHVVLEYGMHTGDFKFVDDFVAGAPVYVTIADVDYTTTFLAGGFHHSIGDNVDGFVNLGYYMAEIDYAAGVSADDSGMAIEFGFRAHSDSLEIGISARYADLPSENSHPADLTVPLFGDRYSAKVGLGWNFTDMFGLTFAYRTGNDQAATIGARVSF